MSSKGSKNKGQQMIQMVFSKQWVSELSALGILLAGTIFLPFTSHGDSSRGFLIASKGEPKAEIVLTEHAEPPVVFAAQELKRYVKEISGAELAVAHARSKKPAIILGVRQLRVDRKA